MSPRADRSPIYRIRCRRRRLVHELGVDHVLSAHRTSEGTVTYLRCPCGDVVVHRPGHGPRADDVDEVPTALPSLHDYLSRLSVLADRGSLIPNSAELLHETLAVLAKSAADQGVVVEVPGPTDSQIAHLRALGRLAARVAGRDIRVPAAFSCRLDDLVPELVAPGIAHVSAPCCR